MRPLPIRVLKTFFVIALSLALLWEAGINLVLRTPLGLQLLNADPSVLEIHYTRATCWVPFVVEVEGLTIRVQDAETQVYITAGHAKGTITPLTLVTRRFRAQEISADDVTFRMRRRLSSDKIGRINLAHLPPIPGFGSAAAIEGETLDPSKFITLDLADLNVQQLHDVWIDEAHYEGDATVTGGFKYEPLQLLKLEPTTVHILKGTLRVRDEPLAVFADSRVEVSMVETQISSPSAESLKGLDAKVSVSAEVREVTMFNHYLRALDGIHFLTGTGHVSLSATVRSGQLLPGSVLMLETPKVALHLPAFDASGGGTVQWRTDAEGSQLAVYLDHIEFLQRSTGKIPLRGSHFRLLASSRGLDLTRDQPLEVAIKLEGGKAHDFSFLNAFMPPGGGLKIVSGQGDASAEFALSTGSKRAHGTVNIDADTLVLQNRGATLSGRAAIRGKLIDLDLNSAAMNLAGSSVTLVGVTIHAHGEKTEGFSAALVAEACLVRPSPSNLPPWEATLALQAQNLKPILDIVSVNVPLPWALRAVANTGEVKARLSLVVNQESVVLKDLKMTAGRVELEGQIRMLEVPQATGQPVLMPFGAAFAKVSGIEIGVSFDGPQSTVVLIDPKGWYRSQQTAAMNLK